MHEVESAGRSTVRRGRQAEGIAALFLEMGGYRILARNVRCGPLEIDLVAARGATLAFVEVRARASRAHGSPEESVLRLKREHVTRAAERFIGAAGLPPGLRARFDVIAVEIGPFGLCLRHRLDFWRPR
jgi:putative endonuclease